MNSLQKKLEEARKAHSDMVEWHENNAQLLAPIYQKVEELGGDFAVSGAYASLSLAGDKHKLAELVRVLRAAGFKTGAEPPKMGDTSWSPTFIRPNTEGWLWLFFTSTVCRRVKVGTKIVPATEIDVYETVCGEVDGNGEPIASPPKASDEIQF